MYRALIQFLIFQFTIIKILFKSKDNLVLEIVELRQQLATYKAKKIKPKNITDITRSYLIALKETWAKWKDVLSIVKPETVIGWQKKRFKKYWTKLSNKNKNPGRPSIKLEIGKLIKRMAKENLGWGAPKITSELRKIGYSEEQVSQRTVSRYLLLNWRKSTKAYPIVKGVHMGGGIDKNYLYPKELFGGLQSSPLTQVLVIPGHCHSSSGAVTKSYTGSTYVKLMKTVQKRMAQYGLTQASTRLIYGRPCSYVDRFGRVYQSDRSVY